MENKILDALELYPERNYLKSGFTSCEFIVTDDVSEDNIIKWFSGAYLEEKSKLVFVLTKETADLLLKLIPLEEIGFCQLNHIPHLVDLNSALTHLSRHNRPLYELIFNEVIYERKRM